jgi:thiol-disulfide isomerase/thioredoxin
MPSQAPSARNLGWKTLAPVAVIVVLAAGGLLLIRGKSGTSLGRGVMQSPSSAVSYAPIEIRVGSQLPDFVLKKFGAGEVKASELGSRVTLINFWATWCEPCVIELPSLVKLHEKFKAKGFDIVAINVDDNPEQVLPRAIQKYGLNFGVYLDPGQKLSELFDVQNIPLTVVMDRERKILFVEPGGRDWNDGAAQAMVQRWLSG